MGKRGLKTLNFFISIPCQPKKERDLLQNLLQATMIKLHQAKIIRSFEEFMIGDRYVFSCLLPEHEKKRLRLKISCLVTDFFFTHMEKSLIRNMIDQQYHSPYPEDIDEIEERFRSLLNSVQQEALVEKERFVCHVRSFLEESTSLAIDGYIRFRTKSYRQWLSRLVQQAIDEYLLDREYKEFIQLLKYFISIQKSRFICVHVIHKGSKTFQLLKEDGTPIKANELDKTFHEMMGQSFSGEDFIVGALLSTAPEQVVLHTTTPDENVIKTLLQVFDGRISVCTGCQHCYTT